MKKKTVQTKKKKNFPKNSAAQDLEKKYFLFISIPYLSQNRFKKCTKIFLCAAFLRKTLPPALGIGHENSVENDVRWVIPSQTPKNILYRTNVLLATFSIEEPTVL